MIIILARLTAWAVNGLKCLDVCSYVLSAPLFKASVTIVSCILWALVCVIWLLVLCHWIYTYILCVLWPCSGYLSYYRSLTKKIKILILKLIFPSWVSSLSTSHKHSGWWFLIRYSQSLPVRLQACTGIIIIMYKGMTTFLRLILGSFHRQIKSLTMLDSIQSAVVVTGVFWRWLFMKHHVPKI